MTDRRPLIAVTLGDPGGIGPEIAVKAWANDGIQQNCQVVIIGDESALRSAMECVRSRTPIKEIVDADGLQNDSLCFISPDKTAEPFKRGKVAAANGRAAHGWIVHAAQLALAGTVDAICTAPISKEAMFAAGFVFPGHTELLAELSGGVPVRMMLAGGGLRVVLQTIHVALASVPQLLTTDAITHSLSIMHHWSETHLGRPARIAVCGLNPHAGEAGHFGREEIDIIAPAIAAAQQTGIDATGPYPGDTVFHRAREGDFDLVLAMYHDQALIPVKTLDFHHGVNITLGLPFVRTSPDHGTAFDLAGRGIANESSMVSAILAAAELARARATS